MKNLIKQDETTKAIKIQSKIKASELDLTEYKSIIDCYYLGINGWTYSHSLLDDTYISLDTSEDYQDLFLTRAIEDNPEPLLYLSDTECAECEIIIWTQSQKIQAQAIHKNKPDTEGAPIINPEYRKTYFGGLNHD